MCNLSCALSVKLVFGTDPGVQQWAKGCPWVSWGPPAHTHRQKGLLPGMHSRLQTHKGVGVNRHRFQLLFPVRLKFKFIKIGKFGIVHGLNFMDNLSINTTTMLHITKIVTVHRVLIKLAGY